MPKVGDIVYHKMPRMAVVEVDEYEVVRLRWRDRLGPQEAWYGADNFEKSHITYLADPAEVGERVSDVINDLSAGRLSEADLARLAEAINQTARGAA